MPSVLIALQDGQVVGSASLIACDLPSRAELTPWLAQLFVEPARQRAGVGAVPVTAILERARDCGHAKVYLYTSGTLPQYCTRLGWRAVERVTYLQRERTVMVHDV